MCPSPHSVNLSIIICKTKRKVIKLHFTSDSSPGAVSGNQDIPLNTPLALEHWNNRAGMVSAESARRLSLAYCSWPPIASQKSGFS
jgi:hypothetical protein